MINNISLSDQKGADHAPSKVCTRERPDLAERVRRAMPTSPFGHHHFEKAAFSVFAGLSQAVCRVLEWACFRVYCFSSCFSLKMYWVNTGKTSGAVIRSDNYVSFFLSGIFLPTLHAIAEVAA